MKCKHEIEERTCAICNRPESRKDSLKPRFRHPETVGLRAQFEGVCGLCGDEIEIGDLIVPDPTETTERTWVHKRCAREVEAIEAIEKGS